MTGWREGEAGRKGGREGIKQSINRKGRCNDVSQGRSLVDDSVRLSL